MPGLTDSVSIRIATRGGNPGKGSATLRRLPAAGAPLHWLAEVPVFTSQETPSEYVCIVLAVALPAQGKTKGGRHAA